MTPVVHPLLAHPRALLTYLLAWATAALGVAGLLAAAGTAPLGWALLWAVPVCVLVGAFALTLYPLCQGRPLRPAAWWPGLALRAAGAWLLALLALLIAATWNALGWAFERPQGLVALTPAGWALVGAAMATLLMAATLAHDLLAAGRQAQDAATREAEARLLARELELQVLRMQIDPHFLFNALNSISALTTLDPPAARAMTLHLAQFFRQTLALAQRGEIRLADELALIDDFLAIERQRLGDRLQTAITVEPACRDALLPPLCLQPLVENALKHGLRPRAEGGLLRINAEARDGWLHLAVRNPLPTDLPRADHSGLGLGLPHLRDRLARAHGGRAAVRWGPCADTATPEFEVVVSLPLRT